MKCVSGGEAQYLCVNRYCDLKNSFVCSKPEDKCKQNHECCSLLNLSYILKKAQAQSFNSSRFDSLLILNQKFKAISNHISSILSSSILFREITKLLNEDAPMGIDEKDKINKFVNDRKSTNYDSEADLNKLQKQLSELQVVIAEYKYTRKTSTIKLKDSPKKKSEIKMSQQENYNVPVMKIQELKEQEEFALQEFAIQGGNKASRGNLKSKSKFSSKQEQIEKQKEKDVMVKFEEDVQEKKLQKMQPMKSKVSTKEKRRERQSQRSKAFKFQEKLGSTIKHHKPEGPFFSKITNDFGGISTFFEEKFQNVNLLFRASEHDYHVSKFHERCDGHRDTLTLILTQYDKVIGGFTSLPWRTSGEWYPDQNKSSFLFNLTAGERYPIIDKEKAIWCNKAYGPSFGHPDLQIADKAHYNTKSCSNFPICYNNGDYKSNQETTKLFCGTNTGHFRIKEWQVYELIFP